ncbi:uncharacterized protein LOC128982940 isoform X1 [Macrosteles quadrilineatus]|uniref:uncharacterized protein LOC128982940 isoform X1 n=1 Tax=Macrosteles quadrilineatus TaxID=74068 RepID=UPI0023E230F5|nr:uncharacterized protein LOC128982940 isoform X1 [Macrosteles quadrilineatus]XP_054258011.1 uncharacterized protein LOC128982940 isoform X1 [Macrosteles quadrilineatus]
MEYPDWLNTSLLESALRVDQRVVVRSFTAFPATEAGDNYTSNLFRVEVQYQLDQSDARTTSLIIKVPYCQGMFKELSEKFDFFGAEPLLYNQLLPNMSKKMNCDFYPKSYPCSIKNGLILEDLRPAGYVLKDRLVWLDFAHCKLVVENLARFHAGSVACYQENPELVDKIGKEKFFVGERMKQWAESSFSECAKTLAEINADRKFADLLTSKADGIWESTLNLIKPKPASLNVLNHGDIWINNILFKYTQSAEVSNLKFLDFQLTRYGSPVLDLIFFTWTSANEDVRENLEDLYKIYLQTLNQTLENLKCKERMSFETLQKDLKTHSDWALMVVCFINNFIMRGSEEFIDVSSLTKEQQQNISSDPRFPKVFRNKYYKPLLPGIARQLSQWLEL